MVLLAILVAIGLGIAQEESQEETEADATIAMILAEHPDLSTFHEILAQADLLVRFDETNPGPITLFAPSNSAFEALTQEQMDAIRSDPEAAVMLAHMVEEDAYTAEELEGTPLSEEFTLVVRRDDAGNLMINDATVVEADLIATNGVVHIIDTVIPEEAIPE